MGGGSSPWPALFRGLRTRVGERWGLATRKGLPSPWRSQPGSPGGGGRTAGGPPRQHCDAGSISLPPAWMGQSEGLGGHLRGPLGVPPPPSLLTLSLEGALPCRDQRATSGHACLSPGHDATTTEQEAQIDAPAARRVEPPDAGSGAHHGWGVPSARASTSRQRPVQPAAPADPTVRAQRPGEPQPSGSPPGPSALLWCLKPISQLPGLQAGPSRGSRHPQVPHVLAVRFLLPRPRLALGTLGPGGCPHLRDVEGLDHCGRSHSSALLHHFFLLTL